MPRPRVFTRLVSLSCIAGVVLIGATGAAGAKPEIGEVHSSRIPAPG
ncbi:MAG: hypothetical protein ACRDWV_04835 [Acidimicrobiales bacterium]